MDEEWRDISGYENIYKVSSLGRVKSVARTVIRRRYGKTFPAKIKKCLLRQTVSNGYAGVSLSRDNVKKRVNIHRLVCEAFLGPVSPDLVVNHKDFDRLNNHLSNLEWVTQKENCEHAIINGRSCWMSR